tara:strand:+ start:1984 stop:2538 length:555 start_codon:yes stop_codon:yes gene_type:complete
MDIALRKNKTYKQLLWIGIGSIVMFFGGLTSAYIVRKAEGNWLEFEMPIWFTISTIAVIASSASLWFALQNIKNNKSASTFLITTLSIGLLFTYSQIQGWENLVAQGVYLTGEGSNPSGSFIYVITLAHLIHLIGGILALSITTIKSKLNKYSKENYLGIELISIYWHFIGLLWLYLFLFFSYS